jgi:hypothetical protein
VSGRVRQRDPSLRDFASYVPTSSTAAKLAAWERHGATIVYLSSYRRPGDIRADETVIRRYGFLAGPGLAGLPDDPAELLTLGAAAAGHGGDVP